MNEKYIPLEKLLEATGGSIFKLTVLAAKRALELAENAKPLVDKPKEKFLDTALYEILEGKIKAK